MSSGFTTLKKKNGDIILFGGADETKPETIEIQKEDLLSFVTDFIEYLDRDDVESLETIVGDRLYELECEGDT